MFFSWISARYLFEGNVSSSTIFTRASHKYRPKVQFVGGGSAMSSMMNSVVVSQVLVSMSGISICCSFSPGLKRIFPDVATYLLPALAVASRVWKYTSDWLERSPMRITSTTMTFSVSRLKYMKQENCTMGGSFLAVSASELRLVRFVSTESSILFLGLLFHAVGDTVGEEAELTASVKSSGRSCRMFARSCLASSGSASSSHFRTAKCSALGVIGFAEGKASAASSLGSVLTSVPSRSINCRPSGFSVATTPGKMLAKSPCASEDIALGSQLHVMALVTV
mmetsp:Transcript_131747/g.253529  ORF Transcript_131747/g.253529 Transcript_131747/m.253529 type:complete len:281 (-) Transcript_131747:23-865(-)